MFSTKAHKRKRLWIVVFLPAYFATFFSAFWYVHRYHPQGATLYACAALPWITICGVIAAMARYLYEERDGYSREIAMRCMLWGAAGAMATNVFLLFLHMFGWRGRAFPPLELCMFAAAMLVARIAYSVSNRPECDPGDAQ